MIRNNLILLLSSLLLFCLSGCTHTNIKTDVNQFLEEVRQQNTTGILSTIDQASKTYFEEVGELAREKSVYQLNNFVGSVTNAHHDIYPRASAALNCNGQKNTSKHQYDYLAI
ncbi:MAG: hypothetical protein AAGI23_22830 [Bacteroidota bacterium]